MFRSSKWIMLFAFFLTLLLIGCQSAAPPTETQGTAEEGAAERKASAAKGATVEKVSVTVPAGTALAVWLGAAIDTGSTPNGAEFEGTLAEPLVVGGTQLAPVGSAVAGTVTQVVSSGRLNRPAELSLVLNSLTVVGGDQVAISTQTWSMKGESHKKRNITMIGGGAGAGALIGAIAGGKKGAAIGGAVGAGAGTGAAAATGKKEIVLAPETKLTFKLASALTVSVKK